MRLLSRDNPKKVIPSRFAILVGNEKIVLSYHSLVIEGPKSLVCRYINRHTEKNGLPLRLIVKYQLKFQTYPWSAKLRSHIIKRYLDPDKGDELCMGLEESPKICRYYGTYLLVADPRLEAPDRWNAYVKNPGVPDLSDRRSDEAFVIQIFQEIKGCDMYNFLCEDGPSEICSAEKRTDASTNLQILGDICEGLDILHQDGIYHSDLKPENVVLSKGLKDGSKSAKDTTIRATIIDFDFAAQVEHDRIKRGTPRYLSPEYLQAYRGHIDLPSLGQYGREFDMWALGAMMWSAFYGGRRGDKLYFTSYGTDNLKSPAMTSKVIQAMMKKDDYEKFLQRRIQKLVMPVSSEARVAIRNLTASLLAFYPDDRPSAADTARKIKNISSMLVRGKEDRFLNE